MEASSGVEYVVYENCVVMECSQDLISEGVNGGRRSVLVGFGVATALSITVASVVMYRYNVLLFVDVVCILTEGGTFFV